MRAVAQFVLAGGLTLALVTGLSGCGGVRDHIIARVGASPVTAADLKHWMVVLAPEHEVPDPPHYTACVDRRKVIELESITMTLWDECRDEYRALKQRALDFLISSEWLIGEAKDQGAEVSAREVAQRLQAKKRSGPRGDADFRESLEASGYTLADVELEIKAELASLKVQKALTETEPKVTRAQVAGYYADHIQHFERPERRYLDAVENLRNEASAQRLKSEIARGRKIKRISIHESVERPRGVMTKFARAAFAAKPHVVAGPVSTNGHFYVFEVTRVIAASRRPLAQVRNSIEKELAAMGRRQTLARFVRGWRTKWISMTDCQFGYIVQKCRQHKGSRARENPLSLS